MGVACIPPCAATFLGFVGVVLITLKLQKMFKKKSIKGKVVVITGASSGLGEECAVVFYNAGAKVILCARREAELLRVKERLQSLPNAQDKHEPKVLVLDVTDLENMKLKAADMLAFHGQVDYLLNNAGRSFRGDVMSTSLNVHSQIMAVNYFGQIALTAALLPHMKSRNTGHIIMISSIQGKISLPNRSAYSASKHALQAFSDSLRAEMAGEKTKIKVSNISPGYINTPISLNAVCADGSRFGTNEKNIMQGMSPAYVADRIKQAVEYEQDDVVIGPIHHRAVVCFRNIFPSLYFNIMAKRAAGDKAEKKLD